MNYIIYTDGWKYDSAVRLDEGIKKAKQAVELGRKDVILYEVKTKAQWRF